MECLTVALSAALLFVGCSDGNGPINGDDNDSPEVLGSIDAPLFVYEILAERVSADSVGIDILDLLSEPRVEQLLMNHVPKRWRWCRRSTRRPLPSGWIPYSLRRIPER